MDCSLLFAHPAFQALLPLLGIPADTDVTAFHMRCGRFDLAPEVRMSKRTKGLWSVQSVNVPPPPVDSMTLYHSPEFRAFADATGFAWALGTVEYVVDAPGDGNLVRITQTYLANLGRQDPDTPTMVTS